MSKRHRPSKEQPPPDVFEDFSLKLAHWVTHNRQFLLGIFVVIVLAVAGGLWYRANQRELAAERSNRFMQAFQDFQEAVAKSDIEERTAALEGSRASFETFASKYTGPLADYAMLMAGNTWYRVGVTTGDFDEAAENYRNAIGRYDAYIARVTDPERKAIGWNAKGYAFESMAFLPGQEEFVDDAMEAYREAERLAPESWVAFDSKLGRARVLSAMADREDEARTLLREIVASRDSEPPVPVLREDADGTPEEVELTQTVASQRSTFGIVATAELMLERLGGGDEESL